MTEHATNDPEAPASNRQMRETKQLCTAMLGHELDIILETLRSRGYLRKSSIGKDCRDVRSIIQLSLRQGFVQTISMIVEGDREKILSQLRSVDMTAAADLEEKPNGNT